MKNIIRGLLILTTVIGCKEINSYRSMLDMGEVDELFEKGEYEKVKKICFNSIEYEKDDNELLSKIYIIVSNVYSEQDSLNLSLKYLFKSKEIDEENLHIWIHLADVYKKLDKKIEYRNCLLNALKYEENDIRLPIKISLAYYNEYNDVKALEYINKAYAIDSTDERVTYLKNKILGKLK